MIVKSFLLVQDTVAAAAATAAAAAAAAAAPVPAAVALIPVGLTAGSTQDVAMDTGPLLVQG